MIIGYERTLLSSWLTNTDWLENGFAYIICIISYGLQRLISQKNNSCQKYFDKYLKSDSKMEQILNMFVFCSCGKMSSKIGLYIINIKLTQYYFVAVLFHSGCLLTDVFNGQRSFSVVGSVSVGISLLQFAALWIRSPHLSLDQSVRPANRHYYPLA